MHFPSPVASFERPFVSFRQRCQSSEASFLSCWPTSAIPTGQCIAENCCWVYMVWSNTQK